MSMAVKDLAPAQAKLQLAFEKTQGPLLKATQVHRAAKIALTTFNDKYGRVIQLMKEDTN